MGLNKPLHSPAPGLSTPLTPEEALAHAEPTLVAMVPATKPSPRSARTRAREFALQALYQLIIGKNDAHEIDLFTRDLLGFKKADSVHYDTLLHGIATHLQEMDALILPHLDRGLQEISPVERACMWIGAYEFKHCIDVPWRVVLNECIELSKQFGGTDGHKYVNAVLNALAPELRSVEIASERSRK